MSEPVETDIYDWLMSEHDGDEGRALHHACRSLAYLGRQASWGYSRMGNAYGRKVEPKPRTAPLDIAKEEPPHG